MKCGSCLLLALVAAGCGDGQSTTVADASTQADAAVDAQVEAEVEVSIHRGGMVEAGWSLFVNTADGTAAVVVPIGSDGKAKFQVPTGGMVTAFGNLEAYTWTAVNPGDKLVLDLSFGLRPSNQLGSVTFNLPTPPRGTTFVNVFAGCSDLGADAGANAPPFALTVSLRTDCVGTDGKVRAVAYAKDSDNDPVAVIVITPFSPPQVGETANIDGGAWQTDGILEWRLSQTNRGSAQGYGSAKFLAWQQGVGYALDQRSANMPYTWVRPVAGFASWWSVDFMLPYGDSNSGQRQYLGKIIDAGTQPISTETVDLSATMLPTISGVAAVATESIARPSLVFSPSPGLAAAIDGYVIRTRYSAGGEFRWGFVLAPNATSVRFPELPSTLAQFAPTSPVATPFVVGVDHSLITSAAQFRSEAMILMNGPRLFRLQPSTLRGSVYFPSFR